jgi:hypothetical protein
MFCIEWKERDNTTFSDNMTVYTKNLKESKKLKLNKQKPLSQLHFSTSSTNGEI